MQLGAINYDHMRIYYKLCKLHSGMKQRSSIMIPYGDNGGSLQTFLLYTEDTPEIYKVFFDKRYKRWKP